MVCFETIVDRQQRARLHNGAHRHIPEQGDPASDQALSGPIPRPGGTAPGQNNPDAEQKRADHRRQPLERTGGKLDQAQLNKRKYPNALHCDGNEQRVEHPVVFRQVHIPETAGQTKSSTLHDEPSSAPHSNPVINISPLTPLPDLNQVNQCDL